MTDLYIITPTSETPMSDPVAAATLADAKQIASSFRKMGVSTTLERVTVQKGPIKELLASVFNRAGYDANRVLVQALDGVKKPKIGHAPVLAEATA